MKLNAKSFANASAMVTGLLYVVFYILLLIAPTAFAWLFNAQFLGANVAGLVPAAMTFGTFVGTLIGVIVLVWVVSYYLAWFYNRGLK